jgi:hypothetical protein
MMSKPGAIKYTEVMHISWVRNPVRTKGGKGGIMANFYSILNNVSIIAAYTH